MLNPHFVAGEHGLFGGHKSEDIRTFFSQIIDKSPHFTQFFIKPIPITQFFEVVQKDCVMQIFLTFFFYTR